MVASASQTSSLQMLKWQPRHAGGHAGTSTLSMHTYGPSSSRAIWRWNETVTRSAHMPRPPASRQRDHPRRLHVSCRARVCVRSSLICFEFGPADVTSMTVLPLSSVHVCVDGPTDDNSGETDLGVDVPAFVVLST